MNSNNNSNIFNKDMFQQTPQKTQGWALPPPGGVQQGQGNTLFSGQTSTFSGPQSSSFGNPTSFGSSTNFSTPSTGFNTPSTSFGGSTTAFAGPTSSSFAAPSTNFSASSSSFSTPSSNFVQTKPAFGTQPTMQYGNGTSQFGSSGITGSLSTQTGGIGSSFGSTSGFKPTSTISNAFGSQPSSMQYGNTTIYGSTQPSTFGSSLTTSGTTTTTPSGFGLNTQQQSITPGQSSWNSLQPINTWRGQGTKAAPYSISRMREDTGTFSDVIDITAMKEYSDRAIDEIRAEDYSLLRKPVIAGTITTGFGQQGMASNYGSSSQVLQSSFTQPSSTLLPQTSTLSSSFTKAPTFGTSTAPLSAQPQQSSSLFGSSQPPSFSASSSFPAPQPGVSISVNQSSAIPTITRNGSAFSTAPQPSSLGSSAFSYPSAAPQKPVSIFQPSSSSYNTERSSFSIFPNNYSQQSTTAPLSTTQSFQIPVQSYQSSFPQPQTASHSNSTAQYLDPYLTKDLFFEQPEEQRPSVKSLLPTPVFDVARHSARVKLEQRPPRSSSKSEIYTTPEIKEENSTYNNLVVVFKGRGKIVYLEPVTVTSFDDLERKLKFSKDKVDVADPPGSGLNKRARVYIEGVWPYSRGREECIKGSPQSWPEKGIYSCFLRRLRDDTEKKFLNYDPNTGMYVYEVNHF